MIRKIVAVLGVAGVACLLGAASLAAPETAVSEPQADTTVTIERPVPAPEPIAASKPAPRPDHCSDYANMEAGNGHPENQWWFNSQDARGYARVRIACTRAWGTQQWECLDRLWWHESKWNHTAYNRYSGATGIPQALPGSKMASHGADWRTNARTQVRWGIDYVAGRYGTPCGALGHFHRRGWY